MRRMPVRWTVVVASSLVALSVMVAGGGGAPDEPALRNMTITDRAAVPESRQRLIGTIWPRDGFPENGPDAVRSVDWPPPTIAAASAGEPGLRAQHRQLVTPSVDDAAMFTVAMPHGVNVTTYRITPVRPNGDVFVLVNGHSGSVLQRAGWIAHLVESGYTVVGVSIPLMGENPDGRFDGVPLSHHRDFRRIAASVPPERFSPLSYFFEPVAVSLNRVLADTDVDTVWMLGTSGGAWVSTVYPAIDPRIDISGGAQSRIIYRPDGAETDAWGTYEDELFAEHAGVAYADIYLMAACDPGRLHVEFRTTPTEHPPEQGYREWEQAFRRAFTAAGCRGTFDVRSLPFGHATGRPATTYLEGLAAGTGRIDAGER